MCGPGFFSGLGWMVCAACQAGRYSSVFGASGCSTCTAPAGSFCYTGSSSPSGALCPPGRFAPSAGSQGECAPCPGGTYSPALGATSCPPCSNTTLPGQACVDGAVDPAGSPCPAGSFAVLASATSPPLCTLCPPGTHSAGTGATACSPCTQGPGRVCQLGSRVAQGLPCPLGMFTKDGITCRACQGSCIVTRIAVVSVALTYGAPGACPGTTTALSPTTVHSQTVSRLYISGVPSAADSSSQDVRVVTTNVVCSSAAVQVVTLTATVADLTAGDAADTRLDAVLSAAVCAAAAGISGAPACTATVTSSEVFATGSEPSTGLQGTQLVLIVVVPCAVGAIAIGAVVVLLLWRTAHPSRRRSRSASVKQPGVGLECTPDGERPITGLTPQVPFDDDAVVPINDTMHVADELAQVIVTAPPVYFHHKLGNHGLRSL